MTFLSSFMRRETGATSMEYALIASLVAVVIIVALTALRTELAALFDTVPGAFS